MKALLVAALIILPASAALAQTTFFSDGTTAQTIGNTTFFNGPRGQSGTATTIGNTTVYQSNGQSSYSTTIPAPAPVYPPFTYTPPRSRY